MKLDDRLDFPLATYGSGIITKRGMAVGNIYFIELAEDIVRRLNSERASRTNLPDNTSIMQLSPDCAAALVEQPDGRLAIKSISQALAGQVL